MHDGGSSLGQIDLHYYVVKKGLGFWQPTKAMKAHGFHSVPCGADGPKAWAIADAWNKRWQAARRGDAALTDSAGPVKLTNELAEIARIYPERSVGWCFQRYIQSDEWRAKGNLTRAKIWWPSWFRIRDMWGDLDPNVITFEDLSTWRSDLERTKSRDVAHKTIKVWRAFWRVMVAMKVAFGEDPSLAVRNVSPPPRHQQWSEGEAVRLVKRAWREGDKSLACIMALCWDTLFSPVDVYTLTPAHRRWHCDADGRARLWFDRTAEGRAKTGRAAIGTVSRRVERLIDAYLAQLGAAPLPNAPMFRRRSGDLYRYDTMSKDFARVRELQFPGETRQLRDMRRSGTVEAVVGDAEPMQLSTKLANSIDQSNRLHKTYAPNANIGPVILVDEARVRGRRKIRDTDQG